MGSEVGSGAEGSKEKERCEAEGEAREEKVEDEPPDVDIEDVLSMIQEFSVLDNTKDEKNFEEGEQTDIGPNEDSQKSPEETMQAIFNRAADRVETTIELPAEPPRLDQIDFAGASVLVQRSRILTAGVDSEPDPEQVLTTMFQLIAAADMEDDADEVMTTIYRGDDDHGDDVSKVSSARDVSSEGESSDTIHSPAFKAQTATLVGTETEHQSKGKENEPVKEKPKQEPHEQTLYGMTDWTKGISKEDLPSELDIDECEGDDDKEADK